jgi:hypothetical protein
MAAVYVTNLTINAGADFDQTFTLENSQSNSTLNLTGYTATSQLRKHSGSSTYVSFNTSIPNSQFGKIRINLTSQQTASLKPGRYVYDVVITQTSSNIKTRVIEGMVLVREGVTR